MTDLDRTPSRDAHAHPARAGLREWLGLALLVLPMLTVASDLTVLFLALPTLSAQLDPSSAQALWIVHIYGFMVAGFLVTMGRLADRVGPRRLLLIGGSAFAALSVLAAFSVNAEMLILARALLGVAGATLMPSLYSLLRVMFRDDTQRRVAIAVITASFTVGGAIGPLLGGTLLTFFWWGSVFLINVPPLVLLLFAGPRLLPEPASREPGRLDLSSVVLSLVGMLAVVYGFQQMAVDQESGDTGSVWRPLAVAALGVLALLVFARRQRRLRDPLFDLTLFANRRIVVGLLAIVLVGISVTGLFFLFTQFLQLSLGLEPFEAGLWTLSFIVFNVIGGLCSPALAARFGSETVVLAGLVVAATGALALLALPGSSVVILAAMSLLGLGQGPGFALVSDWIISGAPEEKVGSAAAVQEVSGETAAAMAIAISGVVSISVYRVSLGEAMSESVPAPAAGSALESPHGGLLTAERLGDDGLATAVQAAVASGLQVYAALALVLIAAAATLVAVLRSRRARVGSSDFERGVPGR